MEDSFAKACKKTQKHQASGLGRTRYPNPASALDRCESVQRQKPKEAVASPWGQSDPQAGQAAAWTRGVATAAPNERATATPATRRAPFAQESPLAISHLREGHAAESPPLHVPRVFNN